MTKYFATYIGQNALHRRKKDGQEWVFPKNKPVEITEALAREIDWLYYFKIEKKVEAQQ